MRRSGRPDAPSGVDERPCIDMLDDAKDLDALPLSLTFAPLPEIFDATRTGLPHRIAYRLNPPIEPTDQAGISLPVTT